MDQIEFSYEIGGFLDPGLNDLNIEISYFSHLATERLIYAKQHEENFKLTLDLIKENKDINSVSLNKLRILFFKVLMKERYYEYHVTETLKEESNYNYHPGFMITTHQLKKYMKICQQKTYKIEEIIKDKIINNFIN